MSGRERRNRKDEAAAASARYAELEALIHEQASLRVAGKFMLADPDLDLPAGMSRGDVSGYIDGRLAELRDEIAVFHDDAAVTAIAVASLALNG